MIWKSSCRPLRISRNGLNEIVQVPLAQFRNESEETAMERRKLTKEDIDKVRNIEGFPIGTDEDIIALSDAPFYTACPNPFIEDLSRSMAFRMMRQQTIITENRLQRM